MDGAVGTESFGAWLRRQRLDVCDLTQDELGWRVACAGSTIRKIESGERRPSKELAARLAEVLGVEPEQRARFVAWARGIVSANGTASGAAELPVPAALLDIELPPGMALVRLPTTGRYAFVPVEPQAPAMTCRGEACNGQDPEVSGCGVDAITVEMLAIPEPRGDVRAGLVELRYSRACQTNWARVTKLTGGGETFRTYLRDAAGEIIPASVAAASGSAVYVYGPMWFAPTGIAAVKACGVIDGSPEVCTNAH